MTDTPAAVAPFSHRTHPNARNCAKEFRPSSRRGVHPLTPTHSVVGRRSSVVGRRSSVVGSRQSAVGSRQSGLPACFGIGTHPSRQRMPHATTIDCGKSMGTGIVASTRRPMAAIPALADCQRTNRQTENDLALRQDPDAVTGSSRHPRNGRRQSTRLHYCHGRARPPAMSTLTGPDRPGPRDQ